MRASGRRVAALAAAAALTLVLGAGVAVALRPGRSTPAAAPAAGDTVAVTRQTLTQSATLQGQISYGPQVPVDVKAAGTLTWLPPVGAVVRRGEQVARVDDRPVLVLYGQLPLYRPLAPHRRGADVQQLESNLAALGFGGFTVDDLYTGATAAAVKRWQASVGLVPTGTLDVGQVVVAAGALRVSSLSARPGSPTPGQVIQATGTDRLVTATVPAASAVWATPGGTVSLTGSGGRSGSGVVVTVGSSSTAPVEAPQSPASSGGATGASGSDAGDPAGDTSRVTVVVRPVDARILPRDEFSPVTVSYTVRRRKDVLTVPVAALLALAEGGYGLDVADAGSRRIVPVTTGMFADGRVEVAGPGLRAGLRVGVPS